MRWTDDRGGNVDDRRGSGGGGGMIVGGGLGTLIIAAIVFFLGGDPSGILNSGSVQSSGNSERRELTAEEKQIGQMVDMLDAWNSQTWNQVFKENGMTYVDPKIVLFEDTTNSACGTAQSAMGPFYCPADQKVYGYELLW